MHKVNFMDAHRNDLTPTMKTGARQTRYSGYHTPPAPGRNEEGFITVVIVLLMLVLMTIIGVSSISMSLIESSIVRSDGQYKRNFYMAESAAYEAAQRLENTAMTDSDPTGGVAWIVPTKAM